MFTRPTFFGRSVVPMTAYYLNTAGKVKTFTRTPGKALPGDFVKYVQHISGGLSYGDELNGLGANFFDSLKATAEKITNIGKEVAKGAKVVKEVTTLIKKKKATAVTTGTTTGTLVVKPATENDQTPPGGIPGGSSPLTPQIPDMNTVDGRKSVTEAADMKKYLIYGGAGLVVVGVFLYVTRPAPRANPRRRR